MATEHHAQAAINGSFFNMQEGQSVCFLQLDGNLIDTTSLSEFRQRTNGIVLINKNKIAIEPWDKQKERSGTTYPINGRKWKHLRFLYRFTIIRQYQASTFSHLHYPRQESLIDHRRWAISRKCYWSKYPGVCPSGKIVGSLRCPELGWRWVDKPLDGSSRRKWNCKLSVR